MEPREPRACLTQPVAADVTKPGPGGVENLHGITQRLWSRPQVSRASPRPPGAASPGEEQGPCSTLGQHGAFKLGRHVIHVALGEV